MGRRGSAGTHGDVVFKADGVKLAGAVLHEGHELAHSGLDGRDLVRGKLAMGAAVRIHASGDGAEVSTDSCDEVGGAGGGLARQRLGVCW